MKLVITRVNEANVTLENSNEPISEIGEGLLVLVGIHEDDYLTDLESGANKLVNIRLWPNDEDKQWKTSVLASPAKEVLLVSQFTLHARLKKPTPDYCKAMPSEDARRVFNLFVAMVKKKLGEGRVKTGAFGEMMNVASVNSGPVTILYDSFDYSLNRTPENALTHKQSC